MAITVKDVEHIAWLARLDLTAEDKKRFAKQLDQILEHAGRIAELDMSEVSATSHVLSLKNVFREDKLEPSLSGEEALSNAPRQEKGAFVVPRIIGSEE